MDCHVSTSKRKHQKTGFSDMNQLDHINKLPCELLLMILDKLPMEEAISTSLVSKRWKDLWKSKSRIDLGYSWVQKTGKMVLDSLYNVIYAHREPKIQCISVAHRHYPSMYYEMGLLMGLAASKNVEEVYLDMNDKEDTRKRWTRQYPVVVVPEYFSPKYKISLCSSLTKLSIKFSRLKTIPPLRFIALREFFLEHVMLFDDAVEKITTNCPSLELLSLCNCNPTSHLRIIVAVGSGLVHLVIKEELIEVTNKTELFIKAVNVKIIEFGLALPRKEYHLEGTLECSEYVFRLNQMHHSRQALRVTSLGLRGNFSSNYLGLLNEFRSGKVLTLSSWCIQVLSIEVVKLQAPKLFEATQLTLETGLKRWEFPGIAYMLLACHRLKNLVIIMGDNAKLNFDYMERCRYLGAVNARYPRALQDLTVVEFRNFGGDYQTWEDGNFEVDEFFSGFRYGNLLLWNFKTYAKNLRKIVFTTRRKRHETEQFCNFGNLSFPRLRRQFYRVPRIFVSQPD